MGTGTAFAHHPLFVDSAFSAQEFPNISIRDEDPFSQLQQFKPKSAASGAERGLDDLYTAQLRTQTPPAVASFVARLHTS